MPSAPHIRPVQTSSTSPLALPSSPSLHTTPHAKMKVIQFVAAALVAAPSAAFFAPVGTNSFVAQQRTCARSSVVPVRMADASEVEAQVIEVVGEQLEKQGSVKIDSNFIEDLDADSLDTVEIIMSLEEKFDIEISEDDAQKMVTVKDAVDYISAHV